VSKNCKQTYRPYKYVKRLLDLLFSLILSVPSLLLILLCFLVIKLETKGPVLFSQERPGYKGKLFRVYKLTTMIQQTHKDGVALSDMQRMTKSGKIIRSLSLDELPQIINILKGDMSFIGPRPLLVRYLPLYNAEQFRRHDVLPGITGWAQVNGRNKSTWEEKFELDVWYVDNYSFRVDVKIFFMTIRSVFKRDELTASDTLVMPYFEPKEKDQL